MCINRRPSHLFLQVLLQIKQSDLGSHFFISRLRGQYYLKIVLTLYFEIKRLEEVTRLGNYTVALNRIVGTIYDPVVMYVTYDEKIIRISSLGFVQINLLTY